ncbi:MAG: hypothetical protein CSA34_01375 [Desulfobulbus propionicus]|nr:MAG: hypothetical protein CSA34_01375 [Desulfobulbus propionicus]
MPDKESPVNSAKLSTFLLLALILSGCGGYYFPHVYDGPQKSVYMPNWKNRSNKLGLDSQIYQSLAHWFQKSEAISITKKKEGADVVLAGEIISLDLPSVTWGSNAKTVDVKATLEVRYVLKDQHTGELLWEVPRERWAEDYNAKTVNATAENEALETIINDLSEKIYIGVLDRIRRQNLQPQAETTTTGT